jgi:hypothetical protein
LTSLRQGNELLDRPVGQARAGRVRDHLRLDGRVDDDALEILGGERPVLAATDRLSLDQRRKPFLAEPLTPAGDRRAVEPQLVLEHLFPAEELEAWVL